MDKKDYVSYWNSKGDYGKIRVNRMMKRKQKRKENKKSNFCCEKCGTNVGHYVEKVRNPYYWDINGVEIYERMCGYCYNSACGDI